MAAEFVYIFLVLVATLTYCFWATRPVYPLGKKFRYSHHGYKALVIVDDSITGYNTGFIVAGSKIEGRDLAKACAMALKVVNETLGESDGKIPIKHHVFHFVSDKSFNKMDLGGNMKNSFTSNVKTRQLGLGPYLAVFRSIHMNAIVQKGRLAVHQIIHSVSHRLFQDWDNDHTLWDSPRKFKSGKNTMRICLDRWRKEQAGSK